jgi:multicomponent Na+:H+ antiporter subunit D
MSGLHPSILLVLGAICALLPRGAVRHVLVLLAPLGALWGALSLQDAHVTWSVGNLVELVLLHPSAWNRPFAIIFCAVAFLGLLFARPIDNRTEDCAALLYAASAVGAVLAGDLFTFYCCWEFLALAATVIVLTGGRPNSKAAGFRYLIFHIAGGLILLFGILWHLGLGYANTIEAISLDSPGGWLIFLGIGINCAWPLVHTWLIDAYPEASPSGVLYLSSFTTKTAVYALLVFFPGVKLLIVIGSIMAIFPIFFAVIENDLRRVLAYSMVNQVGFMVVGVGIGTDLALNGALCHAMTDIVFKGLLFMTVGACLYRTGYSTATDLGGLYKRMPVSMACCLVAAASISAVPGFSGFVSKSMITTAVGGGEHPYTFVWLILLFASAGVMEHAGIKIPFFAFFGHDSGHQVDEVPWTMQLAMIFSAILCLIFGLFPYATVYKLLPLANDYLPYTAEHIVTQFQLLLFSAMAVALLLLAGVYPAEIRAKNLDFDFILNRMVRLTGSFLDRTLNGLNALGHAVFLAWLPDRASHFFGNAPAVFSTWVVGFWLRLRGVEDEKISGIQRTYYERIKKSALPVGASAIYAIILLGVLTLTLL